VFYSLDSVLEAVQACIRDDLWPEASSPWASRQARSAIWALEHVRERLAHGRDLLLDEHRQLTALLAEVERLRASSQELASALQSVGAVEVSTRPAAELLDPALEAEVRSLRRAAEQLAELTPDLVGEQLGGLRSALVQYLHDQDRRTESMVTIAYTC
jgi:AcrR family transcriptional regulator